MTLLGELQLKARYNRWMNERLYAVCAELSDGQRKEFRGAFFGSIHGTFNHLILADRVWLGRLTGKPFAAASLDQELYSDYVELREQRNITDQDLQAYVASLEEPALKQEFQYRNMAGTAKSLPLAMVLSHIFNHQTHHRGQITTLLSQMGIDPGVTDLIAMPPGK